LRNSPTPNERRGKGWKFLSVDRSFKLSVDLSNHDAEVSHWSRPLLMDHIPDRELVEGEGKLDVSGGSWVEVDSVEASKDGRLSRKKRRINQKRDEKK